MRQTKKQAEAEVLRLQKTLQGVTPAQKAWFETKSLPHRIYYMSAHNCWCTHCGHRFSVDNIGDTLTCPECGQTFKAEKSRKETFQDFAYTAVLTTRGDWQVFRYFLTEAYNRRENEGHYFTREVMQKWYNPTTGKYVNMRIKLCSFPNYRRVPYDTYYKELKIVRQERSGSYYGENFNSEWMIKKAYPIGKILPYYKRYGLTMKNAGEVWLDTFASKIAENNWAETLIKQGQYRMAMSVLGGDCDALKWRRQIELAVRHGFDFGKLRYLRDYYDYLRQLRDLDYDLHSPKYLCPKDFAKEHDRLGVLLKRREDEIMLNKEMKEYGSKYAQRMERFKDLCIIGYGMEIRPLMSVQSVYEEGLHMHHCVFRCGYLHNPKTLLLSATLNGERCETIELDMETWKIRQSRGLQNQNTPQHDNIIKLMQSSMGQIKRLAS